jgi:hypothetical protein
MGDAGVVYTPGGAYASIVLNQGLVSYEQAPVCWNQRNTRALRPCVTSTSVSPPTQAIVRDGSPEVTRHVMETGTVGLNCDGTLSRYSRACALSPKDLRQPQSGCSSGTARRFHACEQHHFGVSQAICKIGRNISTSAAGIEPSSGTRMQLNIFGVH